MSAKTDRVFVKLFFRDVFDREVSAKVRRLASDTDRNRLGGGLRFRVLLFLISSSCLLILRSSHFHA